MILKYLVYNLADNVIEGVTNTPQPVPGKEHIHLINGDKLALQTMLDIHGDFYICPEVFRYVISDSNTNEVLALSNGQYIHLRAQVELDAIPEYQAWQVEQDAQNNAEAAFTNFQSLPDWIRISDPTQAESHIDTIVTDLAGAKVILQELSTAVMLMRDYLKLANV